MLIFCFAKQIYGDFLKKPKLVQAKIEELNKLMEDYKNLYEELDKVLNKLKGENNG